MSERRSKTGSTSGAPHPNLQDTNGTRKLTRKRGGSKKPPDLLKKKSSIKIMRKL